MRADVRCTYTVLVGTSDALFRIRDVRTSDICDVLPTGLATRTDATANRGIIIASECSVTHAKL